MGDTRDGRDEQGWDHDRRDIERSVREELARWHETELLDDVVDALADVAYPADSETVEAAVETHELTAGDATLPAAEVVRAAPETQFRSAREASVVIERPTVAAALRRIEAASSRWDHREAFRERRDDYEKTLRALEDVTGDDDDEGITVVAEWIVGELAEKDRVPKSRRVRKRAASYCRDDGYEVRDDDWLGA
jgi:hypothetical protein